MPRIHSFSFVSFLFENISSTKICSMSSACQKSDLHFAHQSCINLAWILKIRIENYSSFLASILMALNAGIRACLMWVSLKLKSKRSSGAFGICVQSVLENHFPRRARDHTGLIKLKYLFFAHSHLLLPAACLENKPILLFCFVPFSIASGHHPDSWMLALSWRVYFRESYLLTLLFCCLGVSRGGEADGFAQDNESAIVSAKRIVISSDMYLLCRPEGF